MSAGGAYDPEARRETPLAVALKARIRRDGPISVRDYMQACLQDPEHGYYRRRPVLGRAGDFVTAPEISQVFGELIGLWAAVVWQQMGSPSRFHLVEIGPGRATLMRDGLRAARIVPGFLAAAEVVLIETSELLAKEQERALAGVAVPVRWARSIADVPANKPAIIVANELLDALPIEQYSLTPNGMRRRRVGLDRDDRLVMVTDETAIPADASLRTLPDGGRAGAIIEIADPLPGLAEFRALIARAPGAALFIDYGHTETGTGDTLQAVRGHSHEHPLTSPGEADLSAQVDFAAFARHFSDEIAVDGPVTQAEFLGVLGIIERASRLMAANPRRAGEIEMGVARLMAPQGMGARFKAIGLRGSGLASLPGLTAMDKPRRDQ